MHILKKKFTTGFTLIELMVSISVFSIVMVISMGAILAVIDSNRKSQAIRTVMDNLNYSLEGMTRSIRFGSSYHCGSGGDPTTPVDCPSGSNTMTVKASDGSYVTYTLSGSHIAQTLSGTLHDGVYSLTSPDVTVQSLTFRVFGSCPYTCGGSNDTLQPQVIITLSGYAGVNATVKSSFSLETTVSERKFDF